MNQPSPIRTNGARYGALYGSHSGDWRRAVTAELDAAGLAFLDPTNPGWQGIDASSGDARQAEIDALVALEHQGLLGAACVVFHLARRKVVAGRETGETTLALASRSELGFLAGRGIRTFVHIEADVEGRNYLWAQIALYPGWMTRCGSLLQATTSAIAFMRESG
jgi:Nucleoside 2-deoxyribosyltransferase like